MGSNQPLDRQSAAYREMGPSDRVTDDELDGWIEAIHDPADAPARGPEWYEAGGGWDTGRETPKTVAEAEEALARRIADDTAPDTEAHRGVYREEG